MRSRYQNPDFAEAVPEIVQNGTVHWWCGEKRRRSSTWNPPFHLQRKTPPL